MRHVVGLFALTLLSVGASRATPHPVTPGDIAPGRATGASVRPSWRATGDGRVDVSDVHAIAAAAAGRRALSGAGLALADLAPGIPLAGSPQRWVPVGNGLVDDADVLVAWRLALGELVLADSAGDVIAFRPEEKLPVLSRDGWHWEVGWGPAWNRPHPRR